MWQWLKELFDLSFEGYVRREVKKMEEIVRYRQWVWEQIHWDLMRMEQLYIRQELDRIVVKIKDFDSLYFNIYKFEDHLVLEDKVLYFDEVGKIQTMLAKKVAELLMKRKQWKI